MHVFSLLQAAAANPLLAHPFDEAQAGNRLAELRQLADPSLKAVLDQAPGRRLIEGVFGNSPFLSHMILRYPDFAGELLQVGPDQTMQNILHQVRELGPANHAQPDLSRHLRMLRGQASLCIALADISGLWSLNQVTAALSEFAQTVLQSTVDALLNSFIRSGELAAGDPQNPSIGCGYVILAMGKLGAGELNYSSDIDLIILFDPERSRYQGKREQAGFQINFSKALVKLLQDFTENGYVFRVDLRLRPDPGATPIALSTAAAESYYESTGKGWERAAMIKARPVAGDIELGRSFLQHIQPFIWRKHLDFAAVRDVFDMVALIRTHHGHAAIQIPGHNIKLGAGGIREIEFFVQTHQLIAGGRDRELRDPSTLGMIDILHRKQQLTDKDAIELREAYIYLRTLEHRLQMIDDAQTQTLPTQPSGLAHIAAFMGYGTAEEFNDATLRHLNNAARHFQRLMATGSSAQNAASSGNQAATAALPASSLQALGFSDPAKAQNVVDAWESFRYRALRTERAQGLLQPLIPTILRALANTSDPDSALTRFDEFLSGLPAGVQLLALFNANPKLLDLLATIMGTAPRLAEALSRKSALLDAVLSPDFFDAFPGPPALLADLEYALQPARDFQDVLDMARGWANDRKFQVGVQLLNGLIDGATAGRAQSDIADAVIRAMLRRVEDELALKHGRIANASLAVLAMGKLGGRELTFTSDLDLIFIYTETNLPSDGKSPLAAAHYFARVSQRLINALSALTSEGRLYEVDMRLRPSGSQGPIAVSLESFQKYQNESAQTWEHMALTRARSIAGPQSLCQEIDASIRRFLAKPRSPVQLANDVAEMRNRIEQEYHATSIWDFKYARGAMMDAEFITQYLILLHASDTPHLITGNTLEAIGMLRTAGALSPQKSMDLESAIILHRDAQQLARLCLQSGFDTSTAPPALCKLMASQAGVEDFVHLSEQLRAAQARVYSLYQEIFLSTNQEKP